MKMLFLGAALVIVALAGGCSPLKVSPSETNQLPEPVNHSKTNQFPESECPGYSDERIDEFNECITSAVRLEVLSGSHTESADACRSIPEVYDVRLSSGSDVDDVYSLDDCLKDPVVAKNIKRRVGAWRYQKQLDDEKDWMDKLEAENKKKAAEDKAKEEAERKANEEYWAKNQKAFALIPPEDSQLLAQRIGSLYRLRAFTMLKNLEDRCWQEKNAELRRKAAHCSILALSGALAYQAIGVGIPALVYEPAAVDSRNLEHVKKLLKMNTSQATDFIKEFTQGNSLAWAHYVNPVVVLIAAGHFQPIIPIQRRQWAQKNRKGDGCGNR